MSKLTKDIVRTYKLGDINEFPVCGGELIYQGAAIGLKTTGYAGGLILSDKFLGFAEDHIDASKSSDGEKNIRVRKRGSVVLEVPNTSLIDVGKSVYALDDNSFTLS
ncbi:MAG: cytoplasmic protein, partial [Proteobacteria bacterium]|nr:cytoplasmic protein [Pseudomonadota bacterium]